jgi:DNA-binding transcriptional MerR regulator
MEVKIVAHEENGFLEYLELQDGTDLVNKSELLTEVRSAGFKLSDRQLTFYMSEGLIPLSVRAGSRVGVYPAVVVELMHWLLYMRNLGVSIDALRELLPVWKFLKRSLKGKSVDLAELELVARQHVSSPGALSAAPAAVSFVLNCVCACCRPTVKLINRAGEVTTMDEVISIGFAIAAPLKAETATETETEKHGSVDKWMGRTRISFGGALPSNKDPMTVRLGRKVHEPWPEDEPDEVTGSHAPEPQQSDRDEEVATTQT